MLDEETTVGQWTRLQESVDRANRRYSTASQMVYAAVRDGILCGALRPGERLGQVSLAEQLGVSRIPVRTALMQLTSEGLVTMRPHRGAIVRGLTAEQVDHVYELRIVLETYALRRAMANRDGLDFERLQELAERLDHATDMEDFRNLRHELYSQLYAGANNPLLSRLIDDLLGNLGRFALGLRATRTESGHHSELVHLVHLGDAAGAEQWLQEHLNDVRSYVAAVVEGREGTSETGAVRPEQEEQGRVHR